MSECENCKRLETIVQRLQKQIENLEKRLAAYENAHTPYSRRLFKQKPKVTGKKRGRPSGLPGKTRPNPKPDMVIESTCKKCPQCKGELIWLGKDERFVEEIPEPQPVKVTKFVNNIYLCRCCGKEVTARHKDCPDAGRFGINVLAETALMKFEERLTFRKIQAALERRWHLAVTPASVMEFTRRVCSSL